MNLGKLLGKDQKEGKIKNENNEKTRIILHRWRYLQ